MFLSTMTSLPASIIYLIPTDLWGDIYQPFVDSGLDIELFHLPISADLIASLFNSDSCEENPRLSR